jgi:hypothetical protein
VKVTAFSSRAASRAPPVKLPPDRAACRRRTRMDVAIERTGFFTSMAEMGG